MSHHTAEYYLANDAAFLQRLTESMARVAQQVMVEANDATHPQRTIKRQALANAVLTDSQGRYPLLMARLVTALPAGNVNGAVGFAYDGHVPQDGQHPTAQELAVICQVAHTGFTDAQLDADVATIWSPFADVLATD